MVSLLPTGYKAHNPLLHTFFMEEENQKTCPVCGLTFVSFQSHWHMHLRLIDRFFSDRITVIRRGKRTYVCLHSSDGQTYVGSAILRSPEAKQSWNLVAKQIAGIVREQLASISSNSKSTVTVDVSQIALAVFNSLKMTRYVASLLPLQAGPWRLSHINLAMKAAVYSKADI